MSDSAPEGARETLREGVSEVRDKIAGDLSQFRKARTGISVKATVRCPMCNGTGRTPCSSCGGSGKTSLVVNDEQSPCGACTGAGRFTCIECGGKGIVINRNRKWVLGLIALGALCWLFALYTIYSLNHDVAPTLLKSGGGEMKPQVRPGQPGGPAAPGGVPGQAAGAPRTNGGYMSPQGGGMMTPGGGGAMAPRGGGAMTPQGGGSYMPPSGR